MSDAKSSCCGAGVKYHNWRRDFNGNKIPICTNCGSACDAAYEEDSFAVNKAMRRYHCEREKILTEELATLKSAARTLAMVGLQSARYKLDSDYADAVDNCLRLTAEEKK